MQVFLKSILSHVSVGVNKAPVRGLYYAVNVLNQKILMPLVVLLVLSVVEALNQCFWAYKAF